MMNRREAMSAVAWLLGGTIVGADLLVACTPNRQQVNVEDLFKQEQVLMLDEIADTILPETNTPSAKAAEVGPFMAVMVKDCYTPAEQRVFTEGLGKLEEACEEKYGKSFLKCDAKQRKELLTSLDQEQKAYMHTKKAEEPSHYFRMMKELTLLGFFTSEVGATQALRHVAVPGRYDGSMPYKKGDRAWATS
ncbi:gluconate 2-dehydrogenase subunit 3 family protein [Pontibacter harenae]|uniref:gluconate 2-dehydrogenase subunit 3 family protein n=1 Tax=Pontibacter harenae TaxID=2894083 RepID=UPI001E50CC6C|nr:gluconate 2-dehydrogenase subunit 3 family protein [Pontibacter harenae]MCC9165518.1 gluconate 2-dehydrogenase subunit 3 family protein [Pontibacter harenae]